MSVEHWKISRDVYCGKIGSATREKDDFRLICVIVILASLGRQTSHSSENHTFRSNIEIYYFLQCSKQFESVLRRNDLRFYWSESHKTLNVCLQGICPHQRLSITRTWHLSKPVTCAKQTLHMFERENLQGKFTRVPWWQAQRCGGLVYLHRRDHHRDIYFLQLSTEPGKGYSLTRN